MKAIWNETILADSNSTIVVENNHYFPKESVNLDYLIKSDTHTHCPWKGKAHYYHIKVDGKLNKDAAWYYPEPKEKASKIKNHIAFWKGVTIN